MKILIGTLSVFCMRSEYMSLSKLNSEMTAFLDSLKNPLRDEIECLRKIVMSVDYELTEGVKWKGPNYSINRKGQIKTKVNPQK